MFYTVTSPWWLKMLFPSCIWKVKTSEKILYLSFDDGPHPVATNFVLSTLKQYNAKASFFCIGKNVQTHPHLYAKILEEGHVTGNHTYDHLNGWQHSPEVYVRNIAQAQTCIDSHLFRPPYGKIRRRIIKKIQEQPYGLRTIMWSVLSADFDKKVSPESCLQNVIKHSRKGSIIVFHDSEKAWENMRYALPKVLEYFSKKGYRFEKLDAGLL